MWSWSHGEEGHCNRRVHEMSWEHSSIVKLIANSGSITTVGCDRQYRSGHGPHIGMFSRVSEREIGEMTRRKYHHSRLSRPERNEFGLAWDPGRIRITHSKFRLRSPTRRSN